MKMRFNRYIVECKYNGQCVLTNQVTVVLCQDLVQVKMRNFSPF